MCPSEFIETIRIENGEICNISYHQQRMDKTRRDCVSNALPLRLEHLIRSFFAMERMNTHGVENCDFVYTDLPKGRTKCRVVYSDVVKDISFSAYSIRPVSTLRLVCCDDIDYSYKSTDRSDLKKLFEQRGDADDVLICRNGLITDTSIGNVALFDGSEWHTPASPLLCGTQRQYLIDNGVIKERDIPASEISKYKKIAIINAMIPFGELEVSVENCGTK